MSTSFPGALDSYTDPTSSDKLNSPSHSQQHQNHNDAVEAIEAKVGTGASTPTANKVLRATGTGTTSYAQLVLTTDVTGSLPIANGGTAATTASGARTSLGVAIGSDVQAFDSDLSTIAGLTATTDNFIQSVSSAWASRTPAQAVIAIGNIIYPIGIIVQLTVSTNPSTLFGFGTWAYYGDGRVLVGIDTGQTEFDVAGETGGSKTHTLTTPEIPAHTHPPAAGSTQFVTVGAGAVTVGGGANITSTNATGSTGGGGAHNNLQPYIVVYRWQRTA